MIPKIIHYCWFGRNPLPNDALRCIESWKKYCPDYKIIEWNEYNFDINQCQYIADAYKEKKYAFVSDYVRFYILYKQGGIYLDTDVELIKSIDSVRERGPFFGCENTAIEGKRKFQLRVAPGLAMGAEAGNPFYKEMIDFYNSQNFYIEGSLNLITIVQYTSDKLRAHGMIDEDKIQEVCGITIYPKDYFCPIDHVNDMNITENTISIHHYAGSWLPKREKLKARLIKLLGSKIWNIVLKIRGDR